MLRVALALGGALLATARHATAQTNPAETRWAVAIRGPVSSERGELRLSPQGGRLLLESSDTAWLRLRDFTLANNRLSFTIASSGRRFDGQVGQTALQGTSSDSDGRILQWEGERILPGIARWPVRPRVQIRQLVIGTTTSQVTLPAGWRTILPSPATIASERDALAQAAGLRVPTIQEMLGAQRVPMGFDSATRVAVHALLQRISRGPAANDGFRRIFETPTGFRTDLHQVAFAARNGRANSADGSASLVRGLAALSRGVPAGADSLSLYSAAWRVWTRSHTDTTDSQMLLDALAQRDPDANRAVRAVIAGYDDAVAWWVEAVQWLMQNPWIETSAGFRSPADLVSAFWGQRALPVPPVEPTHFGTVQAVPVVGAARLGTRLIRPLNASASDWLQQGGLQSALDAWRRVDGEDSLTIVRDGRTTQLTSPGMVTRSRLGGFLSGRDAIRMEPGISPVFAVVTAVHEWQHLLFEGARLEGKSPGVSDTPDELVLLDGNPWLAEGAAEWAAEMVLAPARVSTPLLLYMETLKRASIDALTGGDDPHALGYLLVRALAARTSDPAVLRERLIRLLHDPVALAQEYRLETAVRGVPPIRLNRPNGAGVIPEIVFTWDDGVADNVSRRLIIPAHPQEH